VIANATPLICLSKINKLRLLKELYLEVFIPPAVRDEILVKDKEDCIHIEKALKEGWLKVKKPRTHVDYQVDEGENQALNLAFEFRDTIILDDAHATKIARILDIKYIRTTTVILQARAIKKLTRKQALDALNQLIEKGYYIKPPQYSKLITALHKN